MVVSVNRDEGASVVTGSEAVEVASGGEKVKVCARGSTGTVERALVEAVGAFDCSWFGRPVVDTTGEVTRREKGPAHGFRGAP
ncbi:hypothetical protein MRX96_033876 [Rhipicephalus microplus]